MRAIVLDNGLSLRRHYPEPPRIPGESIVKVRLAGICGTDLELVRGYMNYSGVPGHEFVGEVVESRSAALAGRRVVGEINAACGACRLCAEGLRRHCPNRTVLGILNRSGAFAEFLTLPDENLFVVPDSLPDETAVFTEPVAAAFEIFEQILLDAGTRVLVLGDGRLGAIVAMTLGTEGYSSLLAGHHPEKIARLRQIGLAAVHERELSGSFDIVVDCTGSGAGFERALGLARPRGTIVLKSTVATGASVNLVSAVINEVTIVGSRCGRFAPALAALEAGRLDPRPLISASFPLEDGLRGFEDAATPSSIKVLLSIS